MNTFNSRPLHRIWPVALLVLTLQTQAGSLQLLSQPQPTVGAPAGGDGDSVAPIFSADGRYVLFASSADDLVSTNGSPLFRTVSGSFNVFLRDRTNKTTILVSVSTSGQGGGNADSIP